MDGAVFNFFRSTFAIFGLLGVISLASGFVAYGIFRYLGSKWLENHFAVKLESFKHKQALEIEDTKYRINRLFDRASKSHQNEYVYLPGAWEKLMEAFHHARASLGRLQQYADIQGSDDDVVRRHMEARGHSPEAIAGVLRSVGRQKEHQKVEDYFRLRAAEKYYDAFMNYLFANQIFIRPEISLAFEDLGALLRNALIERESQLEFPNQHRSSFPALKDFRDDGDRRVKALEKTVRDRLADTISEPAAGSASAP